jgi:hypothetical protein
MVDRRSEKKLWKDGNDEGDEQELKELNVIEDDETRGKEHPANELTTNCKPILLERRRQVRTKHIMYTYIRT